MGQPKILIAGASGYVGRALIPELVKKFPEAEIIALSRSKQKAKYVQVKWVECDLFSLKSIEQAVPQGLDLAIYLVHSMGPTANLDQGGFEDYDLILADNFARTMKSASPQQVIYLGGLVPEREELSLHLESRLEVESVFRSFRLPVTFFRAGLILGQSGSSFQILLKLVTRLPIMICPNWTQTLTTPVDLETVLLALKTSSMNMTHVGKSFDLAGCEPLTYFDMMRLTAKKINKSRFFYKVPFFTPTLSRLWVCLITGTSKSLVYPLVESLQHPMVAKETNLHPDANLTGKYFDLLDKATLRTQASRKFFKFRSQRKTVRSVQRLRLPAGKGARWTMDKYTSWLPKFLSPFIKVVIDGDDVKFCLFREKWVFLGLTRSLERSDPSRQLLYIKNGALVSDENRGRLEFREVLGQRFILTAIHDYKPSLPWFIYIYTQALIHLWVMKAFGKYLANYRNR